MSVPPVLVVDASVAAKWHLTDESHTREASLLRDHFDEGRTNLTAPALIRYEVANTLHSAVRAGRMDSQEAAREFTRFLSYDIHDSSDSDELILAAQEIALDIGASVYDAMYVAYAALHGYDLVTADEQLVRQMSGYGVPVHHLAELDLSWH